MNASINGVTAILVASYNGSFETVQFLIESRADVESKVSTLTFFIFSLVQCDLILKWLRFLQLQLTCSYLMRALFIKRRYGLLVPFKEIALSNRLHIFSLYH